MCVMFVFMMYRSLALRQCARLSRAPTPRHATSAPRHLTVGPGLTSSPSCITRPPDCLGGVGAENSTALPIAAAAAAAAPCIACRLVTVPLLLLVYNSELV